MFRRFLLSTVAALALAVPFAGLSYGQARAEADTRTITSERRVIDAGGFPSLHGDYRVLSPSTPKYNCIAWSLGITSQWVWPGDRVTDFDHLNARYGYRRLHGLDYGVQPGVDKIVLYGKQEHGRWVVTHQARQLSDGTWTSKLGKLALIRHRTPEALSGPDYGRPLAVYVRVPS
jgi:hypothetical protein